MTKRQVDSSRDLQHSTGIHLHGGRMILVLTRTFDMTVGSDYLAIHIPAAEAYGGRHEERQYSLFIAQLPV